MLNHLPRCSHLRKNSTSFTVGLCPLPQSYLLWHSLVSLLFLFHSFSSFSSPQFFLPCPIAENLWTSCFSRSDLFQASAIPRLLLYHSVYGSPSLKHSYITPILFHLKPFHHSLKSCIFIYTSLLTFSSTVIRCNMLIITFPEHGLIELNSTLTSELKKKY